MDLSMWLILLRQGNPVPNGNITEGKNVEGKNTN